MMARRLLVTIVGILCSLSSFHSSPVSAQANPKPFGLPFVTPPGPTTWLLGQQYGNTQGAYNSGRYQYAAGQGLHFGIDFSAPCGTPVVAIGDGEIDQVDNFSFGVLPHNLTIFHRELGLTSIYGHLLAKPTVTKGQPVRRGDLIAFTGDPDRTCASRPHLHLEVRSRDYNIAHNPASYIDADWAGLASIGSFGSGTYAKDLYHPNRWQTIFDQPDVDFNEATLNNFRAAWPVANRNQPPPQTLPGFTAPALAEGKPPTFKQLTQSDCCSLAWWAPDSRSVRFWNGPDGQLAAIMGVSIDSAAQQAPQQIDSSPIVSPDGQFEVRWEGGRVSVIRLADRQIWPLMTGSAWPRPSPGGSRILWRYSAGDSVPGATPPQTEVWIANPDGTGLSQVAALRGGSASWLDDDRILLSQREALNSVSVVSIYTISTRQTQPLFQAKNLRSMSISPGGQYLTYYLSFQEDKAASGMYLLETKPGAAPSRLSFFGGWRWRDSKSILYIPFEPGKPMAFMLHDVTTGKTQRVTDPAAQPVSILNDDWSVSPDGQRVVFWNAKDSALWVMTLPV
jgi:Peptidase family M23